MNHIYITVAFITSSCLMSCNMNSTKENGSSDTTSNSQKNLTNRGDSALYKYAARVKFLEVEDIRQGFDSIQIRFWFEYASSDSGKLIIIKKSNDLWNSMAYYFKIKQDTNYNVTGVEKRMENGKPASGWNNLVKEIDKLMLSKIKDYQDIPGYDACSDGGGLVIEVARKGKYEMFKYPCYYTYEEEITDIKDIKKVLLLIQSEFGYRIFPSPDGTSK